MKAFFRKYPAMIIFIILFVLLCVGYAGYEIWYNTKNAKQQEQYDELKDTAFEEVTESDAPVVSSNRVGKTEKDVFIENCKNPRLYLPYLNKKVNFKQYLDINEHVIAYLVIPDTDIEYPILRHPENEQYYLKHNMDGSKGYPGCIFVETFNAADFEDAATIVYGHNMKNDTMFGALDMYKSKEFRENHPYFMVYTPEGLNIYEVSICTKYTDKHLLVENFTKMDGHWYFKGMTDHDQVDLYNKLKTYNAEGSYVSSLGFTTVDKCVALSTCSGNGRFVVVGKRICKVVG